MNGTERAMPDPRRTLRASRVLCYKRLEKGRSPLLY